MSSQINRLLLSTCLPVMVLSLSIAPTVARAGFNWTPPEDSQEVVMPDMPAPVVKGDALPPIDDRSMQGADMPVFDTPAPTTQTSPKIKTKIFSTPKQQPGQTPSAESSDSFTPLPDEAIPQPVEVIENTPVRPEEKVPAAADKAPVEQSAPPPTGEKENGELSINPFPLQENGKTADGTNEPTVVLPSDPEETLKKITPVAAHKSVETKEKTTEAIQWNENEVFPVVEGFGKDMPLVMVLGQIVPAKYAYSFGKGVNPGALVSWEGGKPWNEVLQSVLDPLGIGMSVENQTTLSLFIMNAQRSEEIRTQDISTSPAAKESMGEEKTENAVVVNEDSAVAPAPGQDSSEKNPASAKKSVVDSGVATPLPDEDITPVTPEPQKTEAAVTNETDKTTALQAEQMEKIKTRSVSPAPAAPKPIGQQKVLHTDTERYNAFMPVEAEQKKK